MRNTGWEMAARRTPDTPTQVSKLLQDWAGIWGVPELVRTDVRFSKRLIKTLGRTHRSTRRITLADRLRNTSNAELLVLVLCHEAAHVAVHCLHGQEKKPHGREWASLVEKAGFIPTVSAPVADVGLSKGRKRRWRYVHSCTVCHATRIGYRPVRQWRCVECTDLGLAGELNITRESIETEAS